MQGEGGVVHAGLKEGGLGVACRPRGTWAQWPSLCPAYCSFPASAERVSTLSVARVSLSPTSWPPGHPAPL